MDTLIVFAIVTVAVVYLLFRLYRAVGGSSQTSCGCGCSGCDVRNTCESPRNPAD